MNSQQAFQVITTALFATALSPDKPAGASLQGARRGEVAHSHPAWSQDDRRIAFIRKSGDARPQIVVADAGGANPARHSAGPLAQPQHRSGLNYSGESSLSRLTWSPDGRKLAFIDRSLIIGASAYPAHGLCVLSADGRRFRRINIPTSEIGALAWSPDARRIAVAANRNVFLPGDVKERRADIWVVNAASGRARKLAPSPGDVTFLTWSPNGQRLLFTSRPEWDRTRATVIILTADGRRRAVLSREPADTFFAAWSPDGTRLVFSARAPGDSVVLEVARSSGKGSRRLWRCRTGDQLLGVSWPARERVLAAVMAGIAGLQRGRPPIVLKVDAIDPRTGKARVLARASEYPRNIAWSHHGRFVAYEASSRNRASHIHRLDLRSGRVKRLTGAPSP